ncbi:hypothetical protein SCP_1103530 [Sparassis crispa]|uniref:Uncharacterized protein n=1 Tax=Sparassis crispa TaxID=139825 RepID=A0A401GZS4_9APHY|nr:hypothetical protein SCP_1103530 [Sparassis crispa]GBE87676.1 hypothetical protein SCP_1103530 [Sparassis crispa]
MCFVEYAIYNFTDCTHVLKAVWSKRRCPILLAQDSTFNDPDLACPTFATYLPANNVPGGCPSCCTWATQEDMNVGIAVRMQASWSVFPGRPGLFPAYQDADWVGVVFKAAGTTLNLQERVRGWLKDQARNTSSCMDADGGTTSEMTDWVVLDRDFQDDSSFVVVGACGEDTDGAEDKSR